MIERMNYVIDNDIFGDMREAIEEVRYNVTAEYFYSVIELINRVAKEYVFKNRENLKLHKRELLKYFDIAVRENLLNSNIINENRIEETILTKCALTYYRTYFIKNINQMIHNVAYEYLIFKIACRNNLNKEKILNKFTIDDILKDIEKIDSINGYFIEENTKNLIEKMLYN